ncbi:hypothetical protein [Amycolatopsis sp. cmx-4-68]
MRRRIRAWVPLVTLVASAVVPAAPAEVPPDPTRRPGSPGPG